VATAVAMLKVVQWMVSHGEKARPERV
jgi:hypothetical protein